MLIHLIHFCLVAVSIVVVAYFMRGIEVRNFGAAFLTALALGLVNMLIKPILMFLTAPINWLTFGLFAFIINGLLLKLVAEFIDGLDVRDWLSAIIGSIFISFISSVLHSVLL